MKTSNTPPYEIGDQLELRIERIVPNGFGIGFAEKLTVFTPLTAPGDVVCVKITQLKKKIAFAEIIELLEASADRVEAPCRYFGSCGGCDFQQMTYAAQLEAKAAIVRDCLKRIAQIDWRDEITVVGSPHEFGYRSRAQWHADPRSKKLGYRKRNSHEVIDIDTCLVLVPELDAELKRLRGDLRWQDLWEDNSRIDAAVGTDGTISIYSPELNEPTNEVVSSVAGERFSYSSRGFFQGNRYMVEKLVDAALAGADGDMALDLYSGVGLFTLPLARKFKNITSVEENEAAVAFAKRNATRAGIENVRFVANSVNSFLKEAKGKRVDFLLLDPPRSGADGDTITRINGFRPKNISYVSCEPSMLARDLKSFLGNGYSIKSMTVLDMFPQTHHVETVVRLSRN